MGHEKKAVKFPGCLILFLLALALLLLLVGADRITRHYAVRDWVEVSADLEDIESVRESTPDGPDSWHTKVRYAYTFEGRRYAGIQVDVLGDSVDDKKLEARLRRAWHTKTPVPAWVNPARPKDAVLTREFNYQVSGMMGVGVFLLFLALLFAYSEDREEAAASPPSPSRSPPDGDEGNRGESGAAP